MTRLATEVAESSQPPQPGRMAWVRHPVAITMACYVLGAFFVTARLWLHGGSVYQAGDVEDVSQATWFIRYTATATEHFRLPALTTVAMNAPHGVNMMWNTSLLLPGMVVTPITLLFGPQVSLDALLFIGFAGSAIAMYYFLRRWNASMLAAALGGALYGFSPALVNSGIGHYSLVIAILPPLIADRVLRLVTGRGAPVRNGIWLGLFVAAELFVSEEALVDTVIAVVIVLVLLALCLPHEVVSRIRPLAVGLVTGGIIAVVLCARALWVQFHGVPATSSGSAVIITYNGHATNLGTLPYAFINPSTGQLLHTHATGIIANNYPQPLPEYLAYLGVPLIIVLIAAIVYFWNNLPIRVAGLTCVLLEWIGLGAKPLVPGTFTLPAFLLPWQYVQHLPILSGMVPDRLCILADAGAAAVLAFSLDLCRSGTVAPFSRWRHGGLIATGIAVIALLPVIPAPYAVQPVSRVPAGWTATFRTLHLPASARVLIAPFPYSDTSQVMRWTATSRYPATMIGGDFIAAGETGHAGRAGRACMTPTSYYIDELYAHDPNPPKPSPSQIKTDLSSMRPNAVVAVTSPYSRLGKFLISIFGQPTTRHQRVLGWRLPAGWSARG